MTSYADDARCSGARLGVFGGRALPLKDAPQILSQATSLFALSLFRRQQATTDDVVNIALRPSPSLIAMGKPKYVTNAYAEAKANAEKMGTEFSGTKYDYYNHPNKEDGTPIYEMEESAIKENYKSFNGGQLYAACRALKIAYNTGTRNMYNAEVLSTLDDYFDGKEGKISMFVIVCHCCPFNSPTPFLFRSPTWHWRIR